MRRQKILSGLKSKRPKPASTTRMFSAYLELERLRSSRTVKALEWMLSTSSQNSLKMENVSTTVKWLKDLTTIMHVAFLSRSWLELASSMERESLIVT